ncbi:MAG: MFS transporter [Candidatus Bathyarchaeota archaeon]|nr:MAG: MFS transporter [Candidatus Bathyarchaeota archaeon]
MVKRHSIFSFMQGNVLVLIVSTFLMRFSTTLGWPYFSLHVLALGGSPIIVGMVYSIGVLAGLPTFPLGGYIADHRGRVKLVGVMTFLEAFMKIFFIVARHWLFMVVGLFLWQLICIHYSIAQAIMADSLPPDRRGIGFATALALPNIAGVVAPFISGYMIDISGGGSIGVRTAMPLLWTMSLIIGVVAGIIRLRFLKETLKHTSSNSSLKHVPLLVKESYKSVGESLRWMTKPLWAIALISMVITFFVSVASPFWIIYATSVIGLSPGSWGSLIFLLGIVQICLMIPMGYLIDRYGVRKLIIVALSMAIMPVFLFTFCRSFLQVFVALLSLTLVNAILSPAFSSLKANLIPRKRRGRLLTLLGHSVRIAWGSAWAMGILLFLPMSAGMLLGGYIYDWNPQYPWIIFSLAIIFCLLLTIRFIREPEKPEI